MQPSGRSTDKENPVFSLQTPSWENKFTTNYGCNSYINKTCWTLKGLVTVNILRKGEDNYRMPDWCGMRKILPFLNPTLWSLHPGRTFPRDPNNVFSSLAGRRPNAFHPASNIFIHFVQCHFAVTRHTKADVPLLFPTFQCPFCKFFNDAVNAPEKISFHQPVFGLNSQDTARQGMV